jgi:hypothetical protein
MDARYEEKTFESYFNNELDKKASIYFPLGQVQEGVIGLDSAAHSSSWRLWRKLGYPFFLNPPFPGIDLQEIATEMELYLEREVKNIPPMKVNLLFQYKRPEFVTKPSGKEWHLWNRRYFRYDLYEEQHDLLIHIENTFGNDAIVLYAAPAIEDVNELVKIKKRNGIIDNSNFRRASELNGHHRNTYVKAGTYSIACSEPKRLDNLDFLKLIKTAEGKQFGDNGELLMSFSKRMMNSLEISPNLNAAFIERLEDYKNLSKYKLFHALLSMSVLREITGIQWVITLND